MTSEIVSISQGNRGQFDVIVNGKVVVQRQGNFFTKIILRGGWPDPKKVASKVKQELAK